MLVGPVTALLAANVGLVSLAGGVVWWPADVEPAPEQWWAPTGERRFKVRATDFGDCVAWHRWVCFHPDTHGLGHPWLGFPTQVFWPVSAGHVLGAREPKYAQSVYRARDIDQPSDPFEARWAGKLLLGDSIEPGHLVKCSGKHGTFRVRARHPNNTLTVWRPGQQHVIPEGEATPLPTRCWVVDPSGPLRDFSA